MSDKLKEILEKHEKWLNGQQCGERANLYNAKLESADLHQAKLYNADLGHTILFHANLRNANLIRSNLWGAELINADLRDAYLCYANLDDANLCQADLRGASLWGAHLCGVDLRGADLCDADLHDADLRTAKLCGANLLGANLSGANLSDIDLYDTKNIPFIPMTCPNSGSFVAWKKANGYIVKLLVPEDARRSSSTGRKCRCDKAVVIAIESLDGELSGLTEIASYYNKNFIYKVGETVTESNFCENRFVECAPGIHFFINRQEAVDYQI